MLTFVIETDWLKDPPRPPSDEASGWPSSPRVELVEAQGVPRAARAHCPTAPLPARAETRPKSQGRRIPPVSCRCGTGAARAPQLPHWPTERRRSSSSGGARAARKRCPRRKQAIVHSAARAARQRRPRSAAARQRRPRGARVAPGAPNLSGGRARRASGVPAGPQRHTRGTGSKRGKEWNE